MGASAGPPSPPTLGSAQAEPGRSSTAPAASRSVHEVRLEIPPPSTYAPPVAVPLVPLDADAPSMTTARLVFTGRGGEYFRIWVVNLLLAVITAGLYSAWTKVRKAKYFAQNTRLDGHVFGYHGNPRAILRGRIIALVLLGAYTWGFQFSRAAGLVTLVVLCAAGPWLFMRSQQFKLRNPSFRGLRFGFDERVGEAYRLVLPILGLWLAPPAAWPWSAGDGGSPGSVGVVTTLAGPWVHH